MRPESHEKSWSGFRIGVERCGTQVRALILSTDQVVGRWRQEDEKPGIYDTAICSHPENNVMEAEPCTGACYGRHHRGFTMPRLLAPLHSPGKAEMKYLSASELKLLGLVRVTGRETFDRVSCRIIPDCPPPTVPRVLTTRFHCRHCSHSIAAKPSCNSMSANRRLRLIYGNSVKYPVRL